MALCLGAPEGLKQDCFLNIIYVQRMRTAADRRKVVQLYEEVFGRKPYLNPYPRVQLNPQYLVVGNTHIERNRYQSSKSSNSELKILPGLRHSLEAAALCVQHEWLSILVGPSSSGKTSSVRLLAQLTGNVLNEISLSSASDITDLLGSFEQYNAFRHFQLAIARVEFYVSEYCSLQLESSAKEFLKRRKELMTRWLVFLSSIGCGPTSSPTLNADHWRARTFGSVPFLVEIIENLKLDLAANRLPITWSCKDLDRTLKTITKLHGDYHKRAYSAKFEWVTGVLVKAIENGEWIVLENANLCNPTVCRVFFPVFGLCSLAWLSIFTNLVSTCKDLDFYCCPFYYECRFLIESTLWWSHMDQSLSMNVEVWTASHWFSIPIPSFGCFSQLTLDMVKCRGQCEIEVLKYI